MGTSNTFEPAQTEQKLEDFIRETADELRAGGALVGLSGGLDSTVTAALCARALGPENLTGLLMPEKESSGDDGPCAQMVSDWLRIETVRRDITGQLESLGAYDFVLSRLPGRKIKELAVRLSCRFFRDRGEDPLVSDRTGGASRVIREAGAAIQARHRVRMVTAQFEAEKRGLMLVGCANRTERATGLYCRFGIDDCADIMPIAGLYRTEVLRLAGRLGVPEQIRTRPPDPGIIPGVEDKYRFFTGIPGSIHSLLIVGEEPLRLLIGTEPPHLYWLSGEAEAAEQIGPFDELEVREKWYTPWGGPAAVRSLARSGDGWLYADIHVGSIMRSSDAGVSWEPVTPELHKDVHQVATCPANPDRVYAQTFDAFWLSTDRGDSWQHRAGDLGERYGRCVTVHPEDPDLILCTVSDGPHGDNVHGQLYRSEDGGRNWEHVADGFPESSPDNIDTFHVTFTPDGTAWAIAGRNIFIGRDRASHWERFWRAPEAPIMLHARRSH